MITNSDLNQNTTDLLNDQVRFEYELQEEEKARQLQQKLREVVTDLHTLVRHDELEGRIYFRKIRDNEILNYRSSFWDEETIQDRLFAISRKVDSYRIKIISELVNNVLWMSLFDRRSRQRPGNWKRKSACSMTLTPFCSYMNRMRIQLQVKMTDRSNHIESQSACKLDILIACTCLSILTFSYSEVI